MTNDRNNKPVTENADADFFLPDFCAAKPLLMVVIAAELLAILLMLAGAQGLQDLDGDRVLLTSFFVQWIALVSAALICNLRPRLQKLPSSTAAGLSFFLVVAVVALFSWMIEPLLNLFGIGFVYQIQHDAILRNVMIGAIVAGLIMRYFFLQEQLRAKQRTELTARLQALQSRIRPHFLFNSMNIIASLIHVDPDKAEQAVEDLSELFRASLKAEGEIGMDEELQLCQHYVNIETLRLGERLKVEWRLSIVPEALRIPALTLQPLIENAIYHGVEPRFDPSVVRIAVDYDGRDVSVVITNPVAPVAAHTRAKGNKMALNNIRQRLQAHYGETSKLTMHADDTVHTTLLSYPLRTAELSGRHIQKQQLTAEGA